MVTLDGMKIIDGKIMIGGLTFSFAPGVQVMINGTSLSFEPGVKAEISGSYGVAREISEDAASADFTADLTGACSGEGFE